MTEELFGYLGTQGMPEQQDYQDLLKKNGIPYEERAIPNAGTWLALAEEIHYQNVEGADRYIYTLRMGGIDYSAQICYAFSQKVPDDQLANVLERIRHQVSHP